MAEFRIIETAGVGNFQIESDNPSITFYGGSNILGHSVEVSGPIEHDPTIGGEEGKYSVFDLGANIVSDDRERTIRALAAGALATAAALWPERYGPEGTGAPQEHTDKARSEGDA